MTTKCVLLTAAEFTAAENKRLALHHSRGGDKGASLREVLPGGTMWFCPWYFDPQDVSDMRVRRAKALERIASGEAIRDYLSRFYWEQWSLIRPPICILCPNGVEWCVDSRSSNGEGWTVTGTAPLITCAPSIAVEGYHGYLRDGVFTDDLENRGPTDIRRP